MLLRRIGRVAPGLLLLAATALVTIHSTPIANTTNPVTFSHTGGVQQWVVPAGVTSVAVDAQGAQGGGAGGGKGGRVQASVAVIPGTVLYLYVGGQPPANLDCSRSPVIDRL